MPQRGRQGVLRLQNTPPERFYAFSPNPLPPKPGLDRNRGLELAQSRADLMLGRLDGISRVLPSVEVLLHFYMRKEAVLSSQIEGTQTTLSEYLMNEMVERNPFISDDTREVLNYVAAMQHGLVRMRNGFPLSLRLLREIHGVLLRSGRGSDKGPGEFRTKQNWVGGTRPGNAKYVPPAVPEMQDSLDQFERFLHEGANDFSVLVQAALLHAQFETIHPFQDGNGRLGRLLVTLLLVDRGVLGEPLLYLSLYLKQHRDEYFAHLQTVREQGTWEEWVVFFLEAVAKTAERAVQLAHDILALFDQDQQTLQSLGSRSTSAGKVHEQLKRMPFLSAVEAASIAEISFPAADRGLKQLKALGIVEEITGRERGKLYRYTAYLRLLNEGTELTDR